MPANLSKPQPPAQAINVALDFLQKKTGSQKVYVLGLQQIADGQGPAEQNLAGWRFLTDIAPDLATASEVRMTSDDQPPVFANLSYGPRIAKAVAASGTIETLADLPQGNFELRLLSIPGLLTDAFWLRSADGSNDYVAPYDTVNQGLQEFYVYRMDDFLNIIRPRAKTILDDYAGPRAK
jgi:hypothetical protein